MFLCNTGGDFEKKNEYLSVLMRNRVVGMYEDFPLRHVSGVNKPSIGRVEKRMPGSVMKAGLHRTRRMTDLVSRGGNPQSVLEQ